MPDETKAYIFPFEYTLRIHLLQIWDLLEWCKVRFKTLFIAYYTDDVGVCNPLNTGTEKNSSMRPMMYQVLNTTAHYRSTNEYK